MSDNRLSVTDDYSLSVSALLVTRLTRFWRGSFAYTPFTRASLGYSCVEGMVCLWLVLRACGALTATVW